MKWSFLIFILLITGCSKLSFFGRKPSSKVQDDHCSSRPSDCSFLVIGHRGAPRLEAENTLESYTKALEIGANAVEIDITFSKDKQLFIYHDRDPASLLGVIRRMGLEGFKYVPYFPPKGSPYHNKRADELTLQEVQKYWGYTQKVGGQKDPNRKVPSLKEFADWTYKQDKLKAIYVDFKIEEDQIDDVPWILEDIENLFGKAHFMTMVGIPRPKIYHKVRKWARKNKAHFKVLYDFEKHGAPATYQKEKFTSTSMGSTLYTQWDKYLEELKKILQIKQDKKFIYPVVAWTVDDVDQLYTLIQKGVDGIITNDADLLYQIKNHHYKDHAKIVHLIHKCVTQSSQKNWSFCGDGHDIAPLKSISLDEVKHWLCQNYSYEDDIKSLFGCDIKADDVVFINPVHNSKDLQFWKSPEGKVYALDMPQSPTNEVILLDAKEHLCNDGLFNYSCEYALSVHYLNQNKKLIKKYDFKEKFDGMIFAPLPLIAGATFIKIIIHELDGNKVKDTYEQTFPALQLLNGLAHYPLIMQAQDDTFQLWSSIQKVSLPKTPNYGTQNFALNFKTLHCNDGFLNSQCEYKIKVGYKDLKGKKIYQFIQVNKNNFTRYINLPSYVKHISLEVVERDGIEEKSRSRTKAELALFHSSHKVMIAPDETFSIFVKLLDYDYDQEHYDDQGHKEYKGLR